MRPVTNARRETLLSSFSPPPPPSSSPLATSASASTNLCGDRTKDRVEVRRYVIFSRDDDVRVASLSFSSRNGKNPAVRSTGKFKGRKERQREKERKIECAIEIINIFAHYVIFVSRFICLYV